MRTQLAKLGADSRFTFRGQFARYGYKRAVDRRGNEHYAPTLLLTDLQVKNEAGRFVAVADHLWFNLTKGFQKLGLLQENDLIQLDGRVNDYYKGYFTGPKQRDLKLSYPSKIKLLAARTTVPLPAEKNAIIGLIMNLEWEFYASNGRPIDDYYLQEFKNCKECQQYDYGVKVHVSAPALTVVHTYDYDDYDGWDDRDDDYESYQADFDWRNLLAQEKRERRLKRAKKWIKRHPELASEAETVYDRASEGRKEKLAAFLLAHCKDEFAGNEAIDNQVNQLRNDLIAYYNNNDYTA